MTNISISKLRKLSSPQRAYLWKVEFAELPDVGIDIQDLSLHAQTSVIPSKEYGEITRNWMNHTIPYPGKGTKDGTVDIDFFMHGVDVYHFFVEWGQLIEDNETGVGDKFENITANIVMVLLDHEGQEQEAEDIYEVELKLAWPVNPTQDLNLDYSEDAELGPHTVSMRYADFTKRRL